MLEDWLGRTTNGRWAAATGGLVVPRQNGKNGVLEMRELFGMVLLGEKFLHTAHEVKTARKAFLRIASFFENQRQFPELAKMAKEVRKTNGQEAVVLDNGGSVEFIARSKGSGRGFTVDVLVCDEVQELTDEELAALLPTISAAPSGNPQVLITGTPPDPERADLPPGEVFRRVRRDGETGADKHLAWTDFGATDGPIPDVEDRESWKRHNPALGIRLNIADVERELALMDPATFARERLGWWGDPDNASRVLPGWAARRTNDKPDRVAAIGISTSLDATHGSIAAARMWDDGRVNLSSVKREPGTAWLPAEVKRIQDEYDCTVVIDEKCPDGTLVFVKDGKPQGALVDAGVRLTVMKLPDLVSACSDLVNRVREETITHQGTTELDQAIGVADWRDVGDGRRVFGRKRSSGPVDMLEAATAAMWGAVNSPVYDVMDSIY